MDGTSIVPVFQPQQSFEVSPRELARHLVMSGQFGDLDEPEEIEKQVSLFTAKIILGQTLGIDASTSISSIYFVNGKPDFSADLKRQWITQSGRYRLRNFQELRHETSGNLMGMSIEVWERVDGTWEILHTESYTLAEAAQAGLLSGVNWQKYPADMLWAALIRRVFTRWTPDAVPNQLPNVRVDNAEDVEIYYTTELEEDNDGEE